VDRASGQALAEVRAAWASRHSQHQARLSGLGQNLAAAAAEYTGTDGDSARDLHAAAKLAGEMGL
jgi:hypothetical protein